ncbi:rRNA maturation RNase YbeY [Jannaschia aquimarina]|uniref:Endoribonuclease YbeY n=1 Tax=Jannaschia aquimarina TaxID=935700 RepID=A0A0D1CP00_9RHOB|nr:rRNA maturation RNase YbeY [Jannaschia aquimarina]KIT16497.1 Endoribonuclease YbeY [Jannaschia aquimarina]SNT07163.1 probable rRNA maturation factor [Jannaschia aquimarina]
MGDVLIDVIVEDDRWVGLQALADSAVPAALGDRGVSGEVVVLGCDDTRIAALNADFRGKSRPTNVLSWPSAERDPGSIPDEEELGDIAISYDTCAREAAEQGKAFDEHVIHLLIHATLHLLGHDHQNEAEASRMETIERNVMASLGLPDPYRDDILHGPCLGPD